MIRTARETDAQIVRQERDSAARRQLPAGELGVLDLRPERDANAVAREPGVVLHEPARQVDLAGVGLDVDERAAAEMVEVESVSAAEDELLAEAENAVGLAKLRVEVDRGAPIAHQRLVPVVVVVIELELRLRLARVAPRPSAEQARAAEIRVG
jgi:hypothetical protein